MKIATEELKKKFGKQLLINEKLSNYSWFNLGGPADLFFKPNSIEDILLFLGEIKQKKFTVIGAGSNTLIRDGGIKGITIKLSSAFSYANIEKKNIIDVGASTLDKKIADFAMENSLTGFEFLACIPGSIGGAVRMNTGCYGDDISKILYSIKAIDGQGRIKEIMSKDIKFSYRSTNLEENLIITSIKLIKNPKNNKAWKLIKESKCENFKVGNAKISAKHCNFFVNNGNATSKELEELIKKVKDTVYKKTKISLKLEIKIIGHNN